MRIESEMTVLPLRRRRRRAYETIITPTKDRVALRLAPSAVDGARRYIYG